VLVQYLNEDNRIDFKAQERTVLEYISHIHELKQGQLFAD